MKKQKTSEESFPHLLGSLFAYMLDGRRRKPFTGIPEKDWDDLFRILYKISKRFYLIKQR